jgi:hypothetical protein
MMEGEGGVRASLTSQLSPKDRSGSWFVMLLILDWTQHATAQHTAAVALPWPCRPALSVYIGGRVGVEGWAGCVGAI